MKILGKIAVTVANCSVQWDSEKPHDFQQQLCLRSEKKKRLLQ